MNLLLHRTRSTRRKIRSMYSQIYVRPYIKWFSAIWVLSRHTYHRAIQNEILSSFTPGHVVLNLFELLSSMENKRRHFKECFDWLVNTMKVNRFQINIGPHWLSVYTSRNIFFCVLQKQESKKQVWNNMRMRKWWHKFYNFEWSIPLNIKFQYVDSLVSCGHCSIFILW